jgi:hypothetical protein
MQKQLVFSKWWLSSEQSQTKERFNRVNHRGHCIREQQLRILNQMNSTRSRKASPRMS